jgi:hypothetical protein
MLPGDITCPLSDVYSGDNTETFVKWFPPVNPTTQEVEIGRIKIGGQYKQQVSKTSSQPISRIWWHMPVIPAMQRPRYKDWVYSSSGKS